MSLETYLAQNGLKSIANTTQWRRIWSTFDAERITVYVKCLDESRVLELTRSLASKKHVLRAAELGPIPLRDIEWIEIPYTEATARQLAGIKAKTIVVKERIRVFGYIKVGIY